MAGAVRVAAKVRPAPQNFFRNARFVRIEAFSRAFGILRRTAGVVVRPIPIVAPLPNVASHVIKPVAVGRETGNRRGSAETIGLSVFIWETALPDVRLPSSVGRLRLAPNVGVAIQATPRSIFPFRFGRQSVGRSPGVGQRVL